MKIIIIRGQINHGKTSTAGLLYSELLSNAKAEHVFDGNNVTENNLKYNKEGNLIDFTSVLTIGKIKIGIISAGDIAEDLKRNIEIMINLNIDILICCTRSVNKKGSCYKMIIDDYSNEHKVLKEIWTKFSDDVTKKDEIKKDTINEIIKLIR